MAFFEVHSYLLSDPTCEATGRRVNAFTGDPLAANYYTVNGILDAEGKLRPLSIGQLVMAICLARATELEDKIIKKMEAMAQTSLQLEVLTGIQETIVNNPDSKGNLTIEHDDYDISDWPLAAWKGEKTLRSSGELLEFLLADPVSKGGAGCKGLTAASTPEEVIAEISTRLDSLNTVNQEDLIELQSLTNKRDNSYDLISNVQKSLNTVLLSNARNL